MKEKKLILFDVDGVLLLSPEKAFVYLRNIIEQAGLTFDLRLINNHFGHSFADVLIPKLAEAGNWKDVQTEVILKKVDTFFKEQSFNSDKRLPGKLDDLKKVGYELGIITNRSSKMLDRAFADLELDSKIFSFIKNSDCGPNKPSPLVFKEFLKKYKAKEFVFVGDSPICDLPTTRGKQKITFAAITSSFYSQKNFMDYGVPKELIYSSVIEFIDEMIAYKNTGPLATETSS